MVKGFNQRDLSKMSLKELEEADARMKDIILHEAKSERTRKEAEELRSRIISNLKIMRMGKTKHEQVQTSAGVNGKLIFTAILSILVYVLINSYMNFEPIWSFLLATGLGIYTYYELLPVLLNERK